MLKILIVLLNFFEIGGFLFQMNKNVSANFFSNNFPTAQNLRGGDNWSHSFATTPLIG